MRAGKTYRLKVEFSGSQITLYENDVQQIPVIDEMYKTGQWGLRTFASSARFDNIRVTRSQPTCFVVMPFASELSFVYRIIKQTVETYGLRCERSDEIFISKPVVEDLKDKIAEADLVIVDFTGKNPNVYYEAGLADAWKKNWIILAQSSDDMTFDVRHIRSIRYSNMMGADIQLREHLEQGLEALGYRKQPLDQEKRREGTNPGRTTRRARKRANPRAKIDRVIVLFGALDAHDDGETRIAALSALC